MSVWLDGYTEAKVNGQWQCIDFFQQDVKGRLRIVPCVTGQSLVKQALEWDCDWQYLMAPPGDLSDAVKKECTGDDGVLAGTENPRWRSWYVIDGKWFEKVDFSIPEYCGFFPRQEIGRQLSHPEEYSLSEDHMLSVEEYQELDTEAKKAYQYYEYTPPYGSRSILREFYQAVSARVQAFNRNLAWEDEDSAISLRDVRVLILES